jgi:hypothetical protein
MPGKSPDPNLFNLVEMQRVVSLAEAARLRGVSIDTLKRTQRDKILKLSPRRRGMRLFDALYALDPSTD